MSLLPHPVGQADPKARFRETELDPILSGRRREDLQLSFIHHRPCVTSLA